MKIMIIVFLFLLANATTLINTPNDRLVIQPKGGIMEQKYSPEILRFIKEEEGYAGFDSSKAGQVHPNTSSDYGAYYDPRGFLTTGFGSLVSKAPRGSKKESQDIEKWRKAYGLDPFNLNEKLATSIIPIDIDRNLETALNQLNLDESGNSVAEEDSVSWDELPQAAQLSIVSLSYNTGQLGPKTAASIRKANKTKSKEDWAAVADQFENWHGKRSKDQPAGVLKRRQKEAQNILGITPVPKNQGRDLFDDEEKMPIGTTPEPISREPQSLAVNVLPNNRQTQTSGRLNGS